MRPPFYIIVERGVVIALRKSEENIVIARNKVTRQSYRDT